jgi:hypothetical protein
MRGAGVLFRRRRVSRSIIKRTGARRVTVDIDPLDAEQKVAQTECDDIDTAIAQIAADDADAKAKLIELSERRKIVGDRLFGSQQLLARRDPAANDYNMPPTAEAGDTGPAKA